MLWFLKLHQVMRFIFSFADRKMEFSEEDSKFKQSQISGHIERLLFNVAIIFSTCLSHVYFLITSALAFLPKLCLN